MSSDGTIAGYRMDINRYAGSGSKGAALSARMGKAQSAAFELSSADVNAWALSLLRLKYAPLAEAFERETVPWLEGMVANWPVASGTSKSLVTAGLRHNPDDVRMIVAGGAPYTWFIRYAGRGDARRKWRALAVAEIQRVMGGFRYDKAEGPKPAIAGEPPPWLFAYVARNMKGFRGGKSTALGVREAWARRNEKPAPEYKLPNGGDARGKHAWTEQVYTPGRDVAARIAESWLSIVGGEK